MNKIFLYSVESGNLKNLNLINIKLLYISNIIIFDSIVNLGILNFCFNLSFKLLLGKRFNQISFYKKTIYKLIFIFYKKYKLISKIKSGDINFFSRLKNEIKFFNLKKLNYYVVNNNKNFNYNISKLNITSVLFITYFNNNFNFKFKNLFLNKTLIYYMVNNNLFFLIKSIFSEDISFIFLIESYNFYFEYEYIFNFFDLNWLFLENFLNIFYPKLLIYCNNFQFFYFKNFFLNFFIFLL